MVKRQAHNGDQEKSPGRDATPPEDSAGVPADIGFEPGGDVGDTLGGPHLAAYTLGIRVEWLARTHGYSWAQAYGGEGEWWRCLILDIVDKARGLEAFVDPIPYDELRRAADQVRKPVADLYGSPEHGEIIEEIEEKRKNQLDAFEERYPDRLRDALELDLDRSQDDTPIKHQVILLQRAMDSCARSLKSADIQYALELGRVIGAAISPDHQRFLDGISKANNDQVYQACQAANVDVQDLPPLPVVSAGDEDHLQQHFAVLEQINKRILQSLSERGSPILVVDMEQEKIWLWQVEVQLQHKRRYTRLLGLLMRAGGRIVTRPKIWEVTKIDIDQIDTYASRLRSDLKRAVPNAAMREHGQAELEAWISRLCKSERSKGLVLGVPASDILICGGR